VLELLLDLLRIHHGNDRIQAHVLLELRDVQERLGDRSRLRDAGGFDQQVVKAALLQEALHSLDQVGPNGAAHTAVAQLDHLIPLRLDERAIDANLPNFIDDHREFVAVILLEDEIEEGRLSGAEKAGENGNWNGFHGKA
jgi:hypothetical protein